ncbi:facilitated trehalose transporter Tret1-like [Sitodiplosis mosellana]|uniref:facilitated trehalose transporter Tret1-like n=1 Tax=Sitodiplosis mosellana TaxID=263140 RepID=UPI0024445FF1|nr:facilitated trehalose transporter Tret1-like [Sitodiplosis mosellana]
MTFGREQRSKMYLKHKFHPFASQFIAVTVPSLLLFDMGLCHSITFVIIAALTGFSNDHNPNEIISLTPSEASWLASMSLVFQPIGSMLSALVSDALGRKVAMSIVNIPIAIGWLMMLYESKSPANIFAANMLLEFGCALMESPTVTYVGEISEPKFRGFMAAYSQIGYTCGLIAVAILNILMPWRCVCFICLCVPILTAVFLFFVPESPLWLLSKNRSHEAKESLCWLRGWVPKKVVTEEFLSLQRYSALSKSCENCVQNGLKCVHPLPNLREKLKELKKRKNLKPFTIVVSLLSITFFSTTFAVSTYIVQIFEAYNVPMKSDIATVISNCVKLLANISYMFLIRFVGKRHLYLTMMTVLCLSTATISSYGFIILPIGYSSYPDISPNFPLDNKNLGYIPFICIISVTFCMFCGLRSVLWQLTCEVFADRTRVIVTALTITLSYLIVFVITSTYRIFETTLSMPGVALFNCIVSGFGVFVAYKILPDTENRTLEDIEMHFSDNSKSITDRKILQISKNNQIQSEAKTVSMNNDNTFGKIEKELT